MIIKLYSLKSFKNNAIITGQYQTDDYSLKGNDIYK